MAAVKVTEMKTEKRKNFRWSDEMIEHLVLCMSNFKTSMNFKGLDFDSDKPYLYAEVRKSLAEIYNEDLTYFGGVVTRTLNLNELESDSQEEITRIKTEIKQHNALIAKGKNRVQEKIKEIRQNFSKALISGTRSGSGKIIYEHFDALKLIWGGAANIEALEFGVDTNTIMDIENSSKETEVTSSSTLHNITPVSPSNSTLSTSYKNNEDELSLTVESEEDSTVSQKEQSSNETMSDENIDEETGKSTSLY